MTTIDDKIKPSVGQLSEQELRNILNAFYVYDKASGSRFFDVDGAVKDIAPYLRPTPPQVDIVEAQETLLNLKPELQRDKLQEWQACYAALFNLLNPIMEENRRLKTAKPQADVGALVTVLEALKPKRVEGLPDDVRTTQEARIIAINDCIEAIMGLTEGVEK